jgi:hypothetical protein
METHISRRCWACPSLKRLKFSFLDHSTSEEDNTLLKKIINVGSRDNITFV